MAQCHCYSFPSALILFKRLFEGLEITYKLLRSLLRYNLAGQEGRHSVRQEGLWHDRVFCAAVTRVAGLLQEEEGKKDNEPFEGNVVPVLDGPGGVLDDEARQGWAGGGADEDGDNVDGEGAAALMEEMNFNNGTGADWLDCQCQLGVVQGTHTASIGTRGILCARQQAEDAKREGRRTGSSATPCNTRKQP
jgi:hypothetical protein